MKNFLPHYPTTGQTLVRYTPALCIILAARAWAHAESGDLSGGLSSGFMHPLTGLDHVVAMVAVGLWGAQLRQPAIWLLPVTFPVVMAMGGVLGIVGLPLPGVEIGIALSAVVLGGMVLAAVRPPLAVAAVFVGFFAIFHGYAHGAELPDSAAPLAYSIGFVTSTGLLHASGILVGAGIDRPWGARLVRAGGALVACVGVYFLFQAIVGS